MMETTDVVVVKAKPERRVYKGTGRARTIHKIPQSILDDAQINEAIEALPKNYNFEIHKTIWRVQTLKAKRVALQMPEGKLSKMQPRNKVQSKMTDGNIFGFKFSGLLMYSMIISDIIEKFTEADTVIMGDVS